MIPPHGKDHDPRAVGFDRLAETPRPATVQIGDDVHIPFATAAAEHAEALGPGERRQPFAISGFVACNGGKLEKGRQEGRRSQAQIAR